MNTVKPMESSPDEVHRSSVEPAPENRRRTLAWVLLAVPLGYLWFELIDNLRLEWATNPQYSYGLVVPLLVVGLLLRRWQHAGNRPSSPAGKSNQVILLCALLAVLYLPTRLIEGATPEWRPLQWSLAVETVGLTLGTAYIAGGRNWLHLVAFPVIFFLTAVPWPTPLEQGIIQSLSRSNAATVVNLLFFMGVPAIQHGNVIEVGSGMVGINDACSGIRSFQSSIMISLFLGEFYRFNWQRRLLLLPIGAGIALGLNVCRTSLLTWLAASKGIGAIAQYHDETGMTILLVCTAFLWGAAWFMNCRRNAKLVKQQPAKAAAAGLPVSNVERFQMPRLACRLGVLLIVWLVAVESGVSAWYWTRESRLKPGPDWTVKFPEQYSSYQDLPLTPDEHTLLRFDQGKKGEWHAPDGTEWQAFYFNWLPGRVAGYLAKRHTPDICMTATGYKLVSGPELTVLNVNNVELPMRHYVFDSPAGPLQVYQCHWEAGMGRGTFTADESGRFNLIRGVWAGRGNQGQKSLEIIISGYKNADAAGQGLVRELGDMIVVKN
jgi:exosortase